MIFKKLAASVPGKQPAARNDSILANIAQEGYFQKLRGKCVQTFFEALLEIPRHFSVGTPWLTTYANQLFFSF